MPTTPLVRGALLAIGLILTDAGAVAQTGTETVEEVVVVGRQPGPPLWKVSNGEHVLWILPQIATVPSAIQWESARVETLIAGAQEYIAMPISVSIRTISLNPISVARAYRLYRTSTRLPDGQTLADILPPDLYQRFEALRARYPSSRSRAIEKLTPNEAMKTLVAAIFDDEGLGPPRLITRELDKFVKRNDNIRITDVSVRDVGTVDIDELKVFAADQKATSLSELEVECFERRVTYYETTFQAVRKLANAWAQGDVDELRTVTPSVETDPCEKTSTPFSEARDAVVREKWLAAAESALVNNRSTFAVLGLSDVLSPTGLVAQLQTRGYVVEVSAK